MRLRGIYSELQLQEVWKVEGQDRWMVLLVFHQQGTGIFVDAEEGGVVPVCVCALFMGHIGYISLKTKNIIFFFIIKVFAKKKQKIKKK